MNIPRNQDDIDTARVVVTEHRRTDLQSATVEPRVRTQIEIAPDEAMQSPVLTLYQDDNDGDVVVEQVAVGKFVVSHQPGTVSDYRSGKTIRERVSSAEPLKVLLTNPGPRSVRVHACLEVVERPGVYSIVKKESP